MQRQRQLFILVFTVLILGLGPTFLSARPAGARADLHAGRGEAVWFFRSCQPGQAGAAATWVVGLDPSIPNRTSLNFQVSNAYPGYRLTCELYFANSGQIRFGVGEVTVYNSNPADLGLSAVVAPGEQGKVLQPCRFTPSWGADPSGVPCGCRSKISVTLTLGPNVQENSRFDFAIQVRLEQKLDD